jgi:hypothetical protein
MSHIAGTPAAQAATTSAQPIPYRDRSEGGDPSVAGALLVTLLLLAGVAAAAWHARRRGWLDRWIAQPVSPTRRLAVLESIALSRHTRLYRLRDGEGELLVLESTASATVVPPQPTGEVAP